MINRRSFLLGAAALGTAIGAPVAHRINAGRIPLVFAFSGDPVVAGMVESTGRPGGNTTGMSFLALELVVKRLEVIKKIAPSVPRVAIVANPQHPGENAELRASLDAAERMGVQTADIQIFPGDNPEGRARRGPAGRAADALRVRRQPEHREGAWSHRAAIDIVAGRPGNSVRFGKTRYVQESWRPAGSWSLAGCNV